MVKQWASIIYEERFGSDNQHNCDIRFFVVRSPLSRTVIPITPTSGKGSRTKHYCDCGNRITSGGNVLARQGRFHTWYAINGEASCEPCWTEIYDQQNEEDLEQEKKEEEQQSLKEYTR